MKIIQQLTKDLFVNKTEPSSPQALGTAPAPDVEIKTPLSNVEGVDTVASGAEASKEAIDAETLEALTEDRPLTPEEKKQVAKLMHNPHMTKQEKIAAITLMVRKHLPLTQEVMHSIHEGLTLDLLSSDLKRALTDLPKAETLLPMLLKALLKEVSQVSGLSNLATEHSEAQLDELFFEEMDAQDEPVLLTQKINTTKADRKITQDQHNDIEPQALHEQLADMSVKEEVQEQQEVDARRVETSEVGESQPSTEGLVESAAQPAVALVGDLDRQGIGKIYLRQEIKVAMKSAKIDFDAFKKSAVEQLKNVESQPSPVVQKQLLQKTIEAVDRVLMKSDIPLYTSMKMEKQLLVLSSDLQNVKNLMEQGKLSEAKEALKPIVTALEAMVFKPSAKKVIYQSGLVNSPLITNFLAHQTKGLDLGGVLGRQIAAFSEIKGSPRMVLEHLRGLGLNLEGERQPEGKKQQTQEVLNKQRTLYEVLDALEHETTARKDKKEDVDLPKEMAQSLGNHRLVNKLEEGSPKQTLDLNIPYRTEQGVFELKVHIESRKQDELLDWENFKMFFVLETHKSGQIGIGVQTVDRKLSLTFKAENRKVVTQLAPMADGLKKSLVGVGYQLVGIQYGLLSERGKVKMGADETEQNSEAESAQAHSGSRKGVDFKV